MSYLCLAVSPSGAVSGVEVAAANSCTSAEYIAVMAQGYTDAPTLTDLFAIPIADDLQQAFMIGFALPVICYLTAWAYQSVIGWFEKKQGE
ncbi:hypothetical protein [Methylomonas albis]|uniref:Uncharacterized protein n=1 Tax=Methylomonas albis TaxID=1854563 RepID=A0ABR9D303_9GAMM|nr:hypothetical protein [Methylomonas albis]MBD9357494.1 hypothetical protein [Methylomonas albis]